MDQKAKITVKVSRELRDEVGRLRQEFGPAWRAVADSIPSWKWSFAMLRDIHAGRQRFVDLHVYEALGIEPPVILITLENVKLLQISEPALAHFLAKARLQVCAVEKCGERFYKIGNAKYCAAHSWATREGRRWHRRRHNQ